MTQHKGSCHCGRITFQVEGEIGKVMECNCSHCSRKGFLLWFVPREKFRLATPEVEMSTYTFNKHVIEHHFCPICGCAPFAYAKDPKGVDTAAVNVRCIENLEIAALERTFYDGLSK